VLRSRIGGLTLVLGIAACAHHTAPAAPPPSPAQGAAVASASSTDNAGFTAPSASTRTFLHQTSASAEKRITVTYEDSDIRNVIAAFAVFSGRTIVVGRGVQGTVTVEVHDVPWDVALQSILAQQQLVASEGQDGTITVSRE
jgi:type IV pilus assembly protein PilQ